MNHFSRMEIVIEALDELALALAKRSHKWTPRQRRLYERAMAFCCRDFDSSVFVEDISEEPDEESMEWGRSEARRLGLID
jgi:hypothetical protein